MEQCGWKATNTLQVREATKCSQSSSCHQHWSHSHWSQCKVERKVNGRDSKTKCEKTLLSASATALLHCSAPLINFTLHLQWLTEVVGSSDAVHCSAVWQQGLCKLQLSSGIRKPRSSSSSSHRLKRPTLTTAEYILSLLLLQQNTLSSAVQSNSKQRSMPAAAPALHCFIFSCSSFTDFSQNSQLKFPLKRGLQCHQFHRIQQFFNLLQ